MIGRPGGTWLLWSSLAALAVVMADVGSVFVLGTRFDARDGWLRAYA